MKILLTLPALFVLSGCAVINSEDLKIIMEALAKDTNSVCIDIVGSGGVGTAVIPGVPLVPGGGYGYGRFTVGRAPAGENLECSATGVKVTK